jgi:phosphoribosylamine--glycine ligase
MRILFVTINFAGASLCYRLKNEGNEVKVFVSDNAYREVLDGMVEKVDILESGFTWVGKEGLIVFDAIGFGKLQDQLRRDGYSVVGGSEEGDRLEADRPYCQQILAEQGIQTVLYTKFPMCRRSNYIFREKSWHVGNKAERTPGQGILLCRQIT